MLTLSIPQQALPEIYRPYRFLIAAITAILLIISRYLKTSPSLLIPRLLKVLAEIQYLLGVVLLGYYIQVEIVRSLILKLTILRTSLYIVLISSLLLNSIGLNTPYNTFLGGSKLGRQALSPSLQTITYIFYEYIASPTRLLLSISKPLPYSTRSSATQVKIT